MGLGVQYWAVIMIEVGTGQPHGFLHASLTPLRGDTLSLGPFATEDEASEAASLVWDGATRVVASQRRWNAGGWLAVTQRYPGQIHDWNNLLPKEMDAT